MKRKLISILLSIFAMLLLMGAAANPDPAAALVPEEESTASTDAALETEAQLPSDIPEQTDTDVPTIEEETAVPPAAVNDPYLLINGQPAPLDMNRELQNGTTYVSLAVVAQQLDPAAQINFCAAFQHHIGRSFCKSDQAAALVHRSHHLALRVKPSLPDPGKTCTQFFYFHAAVPCHIEQRKLRRIPNLLLPA